MKRKQRFLAAFFRVVLCAGLFIGCKDLFYPEGPKEWTVTFDLDGGNIGGNKTPLKVSVRNKNSTGSATPANPTKDNFSFEGWYTEKNGGGSEFTSSTSVTENKTVYAKWTIKQVTITYNANGGTETIPSQTINSGTSATLASGNGLTRNGHTFSGWNTNASGTGTSYPAGTSHSFTASVILYAVWTPIPRTITFDGDGGSPTTQTRIVNSGSSFGVDAPLEPTKSGYAFDGWYTEGNGAGESFTSSTMVSANITVYAKWTLQWTVTFNLDGGNIGGDIAAQTRTVKDGASIGSNIPAEPTKSGYAFDGWYTEGNGTGEAFTSSTMINANRIVYAKWTAQWTVTFNLDGGNINGDATTQTRTVKDGASLGSNIPTEPTKNGTTFAGWYTSQNGGGIQFTSSTLVTANITVYAKWTATITFNLDGGNINGDTMTQTRTVNSGASLDANIPTEPTKNGTAFAGWYTAQNGGGIQFTSSTLVTANITVYAKWTATITFNLDGGSIGGSTTAQTRTVNSGASLGSNIPTEPSKSGVAFGGWYTAQNGGGIQFTSSTSATTNITVYAKWTATITFNLDGGNISGSTGAQTRTVNNGSSVGANMPSDPTKSGSTFGGWYTSQNGGGIQFTSSTLVTANITVYAKWTAQWTVTFNLDGGSIGGSTTAQTRTVNSGASLGSNTPSEPSKSGVAFGGWYTAQNGGGTQFTSSTLVTANITVYARWTITVTFNLNGGAIGDSTVAQTRTLNSGASLGGNMPAEPTKSGATFGGWYTAQNGGGEQFIATTTISANMTVYAKWTFTVTFNLNGGAIGGSTAEQTRIATDGSILGANIPAEPTKSGATFGGWYTAQNETQFTATTAISASMSVYAKWTITVTFNLDGGNISGSTEAQTRIVNNGASISSANMPSDPTKSGVVFSGWYTSQNGEGTQFTSSTLVTANITVYAKWTVTITFNLDGGNISGSTEAQTRTATDGTALGANTPANPTKSGATFGGWYTAQNGEGTQFITTTAISANMSVYAKWTVTVTFNLDGGAIGDSTVTQTRTLNSSASIGTNMPAEPTKSGYTFAGWYTAQNGGGEQFTSASPISANMTVYAKWNILSGNADLLSLTATSGKLNPTFSPQILQYSLTLLNSISNVTISAAKVDAKAEIDVPSQIIALNEGQSKTATIMITAENGNKQTYSVIVTREASVFYDGAEGSFDPKYTGRKNAQYTSNPGTPPPGTPSVNGAFVLTHYVPAPYAGSRSLLIGGGTPPLAVNIHERDVYIELNITLERKAEISFYYANSGGTSTLQGQFNLWGWALSTATFSVNGVKKQDFAAESSIPSWRRATVALDAGTNVLRWQKLYGIGGYTLTGAIIFQECLYLALDEIRIVYTE